MESIYPDVFADVNVLVMKENKTSDENVVVNVYHHDHEKEGDNENVVNLYNHDHENETSMSTAQQDEQANVVPSCAEYTPEIDSFAKRGDASESNHE